MRDIRRIGPYVDIIEARSPENHLLHVKLGLRSDTFHQFLQHQMSFKVAEYYGIIQNGLVDAVHAFKGLNRPLMYEMDMNADAGIIVYSWRPRYDYVWSHGRFNGNPTARIPPPRVVFVVLVKQEEPTEYPGHGTITGAIEHWTWVAEDPALAQAPIEWQQRYTEKLWSRES